MPYGYNLNQFNLMRAPGPGPDNTYAIGQYMGGLQGRDAFQQANNLPNGWELTHPQYAQAYSGGGSSGGSGSSGGLTNPFVDAFNQSRTANETRYGQLMQGLGDRAIRNVDRLQGIGDQNAADIRTQYGRLRASGQQDLTARGLSGSTLLNTMNQGLAREEAGALTRSANDTAERVANMDARLTGDLFGMMERRTDAYPDMGQLMQLAMQYGQSGAGGVGGAGYGYGGAGGSPLVDMGGYYYAPLSSMGYNTMSAAQLSQPNWLPTATIRNSNRLPGARLPQNENGGNNQGGAAGNRLQAIFTPGPLTAAPSAPADDLLRNPFDDLPYSTINRTQYQGTPTVHGYDSYFDALRNLAPRGNGTTQAEIATGGRNVGNFQPDPQRVFPIPGEPGGDPTGLFGSRSGFPGSSYNPLTDQQLQSLLRFMAGGR